MCRHDNSIAKYGETYGDMVEVKGIECEFFDIRIDRKSIPEEKYFYEVRYSDDDACEPCQIKKRIMVNFFGTIISDIELPLDENGSLYLEDGDLEFIYI
jgi:hypothetical protein